MQAFLHVFDQGNVLWPEYVAEIAEDITTYVVQFTIWRINRKNLVGRFGCGCTEYETGDSTAAGKQNKCDIGQM